MERTTLFEAAVVGGAILLSSAPEATPLRAADSLPAEIPATTLVTPLPESYRDFTPSINSAVNSPEFQTSDQDPGFILFNTYDQNDPTAQDRLIADLGVQKTWIITHGVPADVFEQGIMNLPLESQKTNFNVPVNRLTKDFGDAKEGSLLIPYTNTAGESKLAIFADPDGLGEDTKIDMLGLIPNEGSVITEPKGLPALFKRGIDGQYVAVSIFAVPQESESGKELVPTVTGTPVYQAEVATDSLNLRDVQNPTQVIGQLPRKEKLIVISDRKITLPGKNFVLREVLTKNGIVLAAENLMNFDSIPQSENPTNKEIEAGKIERISTPEIVNMLVQEQMHINANELFSFIQTESTIEPSDNSAMLSAIQSSISSANYISEEKWTGISAEDAKNIFQPYINITSDRDNNLVFTSYVQNSSPVTREIDGKIYPEGSVFFVYLENQSKVSVVGVQNDNELNFGFVNTTNNKSVLTSIYNDEQGYIYKDVLVVDQSGNLNYEPLANHLNDRIPTIEFPTTAVKGEFKQKLLEKYSKTRVAFDSEVRILDQNELGEFNSGIEFVSSNKRFEIVSNIEGLSFSGINLTNFETALKSIGLRNLSESTIKVEIISNPNGEWLQAGEFVNENPINTDAAGKPLFLFESKPTREGDSVTVRVHLQPQLLTDYNQTAIMKDGITRTRNDYMFSRIVLAALITTNPDVTSAYNQVRKVAPTYPDIFDINFK